MGALSKRVVQAAQRPLPRIPKNDILEDRVNDEQARLAKQGPRLIRNPKKLAKGA